MAGRVAAARRGAIAAIRSAVALGFARGTAIGAAARLTKAAAGIKVLLTLGERKGLLAISAGQRHIGRHGRRLPSRKPLGELASRCGTTMGSVNARCDNDAERDSAASSNHSIPHEAKRGKRSDWRPRQLTSRVPSLSPGKRA